MSSLTLKDYTTDETFDVALMDEIQNVFYVTSYTGGTLVTLPVIGRIIISKSDTTADAVVISPATDWAFADGSATVELTVQYESATFSCDGDNQLYHEIR